MPKDFVSVVFDHGQRAKAPSCVEHKFTQLLSRSCAPYLVDPRLPPFRFNECRFCIWLVLVFTDGESILKRETIQL